MSDNRGILIIYILLVYNVYIYIVYICSVYSDYVGVSLCI